MNALVDAVAILSSCQRIVLSANCPVSEMSVKLTAHLGAARVIENEKQQHLIRKKLCFVLLCLHSDDLFSHYAMTRRGPVFTALVPLDTAINTQVVVAGHIESICAATLAKICCGRASTMCDVAVVEPTDYVQRRTLKQTLSQSAADSVNKMCLKETLKARIGLLTNRNNAGCHRRTGNSKRHVTGVQFWSLAPRRLT